MAIPVPLESPLSYDKHYVMGGVQRDAASVSKYHPKWSLEPERRSAAGLGIIPSSLEHVCYPLGRCGGAYGPPHLPRWVQGAAKPPPAPTQKASNQPNLV